MKLWDDFIELLFPSSHPFYSEMLLLGMSISGIVIIPILIFWAHGLGIKVPPYLGVIYGAYVMFLAPVWKTHTERYYRSLFEARATVIGLKFIRFQPYSDEGSGQCYPVYSPLIQFTDSRGEQITTVYPSHARFRWYVGRYLDRDFIEKRYWYFIYKDSRDEKLSEDELRLLNEELKKNTLDILYDPEGYSKIFPKTFYFTADGNFKTDFYVVVVIIGGLIIMFSLLLV